MNKAEAIWAIDERVDGIYNDLRAYVYIRIKGLQHGPESIGGGNITQAIALFSVLNFLGKIQYYFDKLEHLPLDSRGEPVIVEERGFIHLIRKLDSEHINLGLPADNSDALKLVWSGFRNKLAHVSNPEFGKQIMAYTVDDRSGNLTIDGLLTRIMSEDAFTHDGNLRNWHLNVDVLLAKLPHVKDAVKRQLHSKDTALDYATLEKIMG